MGKKIKNSLMKVEEELVKQKRQKRDGGRCGLLEYHTWWWFTAFCNNRFANMATLSFKDFESSNCSRWRRIGISSDYTYANILWANNKTLFEVLINEME